MRNGRPIFIFAPRRLRATLHPANLPPALDRNLVLFLVLAPLFFWTGWPFRVPRQGWKAASNG